MINKKLLKILNEIDKLDNKNFNLVKSFDDFQIKLINLLQKKRVIENKIIFNKIKTHLSRAEKYRSYSQLIEKKIIIKKKLTTCLNNN